MYLNKNPSGFHGLLRPCRDYPRANLLVSNNAGWRSMMIMGQRTYAAQKQEAHQTTKKVCKWRSPHSWKTRVHGQDVYAGRDCHAHVQTALSASCCAGNMW